MHTRGHRASNGTLPDGQKSEDSNGLPPPNPGVRLVHTPDPGWRPGVKQPHPYPGTKMLQLSPEVEGVKMYPFVISAIVPRPIAFISSLSKEGKGNLSPYSYFNVMSHDPPYVTIGCAHTRGRPNHMKDSEQNLLETGEFTLNMMSEWFVESANHTCGSYDRGVDELELAGLMPVPSVIVKPPRVAESVVQLECKLRGTYEVKNTKGDSTGRIMIGEVVLVHVAEAVVNRSQEGKLTVDLAKYRPVSRLGGDSYARICEAYDLPRPDTFWQAQGPTSAAAKAGHGG
ncbi:hypothetical protein WJX81_000759 [Elliptochloris bilobata]|uniref:Flavin reductase like domain-containing protein n=1 Tax=Elliptochloris bilobata TaxID=381761 RepID=A0AAW1RI54_9CHLO